VVETIRGIEIGETVTGAREVADDQIVAPLKKVVRIATADDITRAENTAELEREAFAICLAKIEEHKLGMKLIEVEYSFDNSKVIFYFTAGGRVDFRELVKDLAGVFKTRIELHQIGVRDEAKLLGGLGSCGRSVCCGTFLSDFQPVSIKMAKEQNLSLNPTKISGQCGRLMCCLKYEQEYYESVLKRVPRIGREVTTPDGQGVVIEINVLREKIKARVRLNDDSYEMREYSIDSIQHGLTDANHNRKADAADTVHPPRNGDVVEAVTTPRNDDEAKLSKRRMAKSKNPKRSANDYFGNTDKTVPETDEKILDDDFIDALIGDL
jgi:cell fate regulator YaaT (PSP1 superfamily)